MKHIFVIDDDIHIGNMLEEILFANTAPNLTEVQAGRLFDRFYTVESAKTSTGLGLSIARTLVEQMGGSISAEYKNHRLWIRIVLPDC